MGINETILKELEKHLELNNLSPSSFATKINVNRSSITRFLDGKFKASSNLLEKIAKEIGGKIKYVKNRT